MLKYPYRQSVKKVPPLYLRSTSALTPLLARNHTFSYICATFKNYIIMDAEKKETWFIIFQVLKVVITAVCGYLGGSAVSSCAHYINF